MKKLISVLILSSLLILGLGCGSDEEAAQQELAQQEILDNYQLYASEDFSIRYPKGWSIETNFSEGYPATTAILFVNDESDSRFKENINIDKRTVKSGTSSLSYAKQLMSQHQSELISFQEITRKEITIKIGEETVDGLLTVFEGKNQKEGDRFKFIQVYAVKGTDGYIATATMLSSTEGDIINTISTSLQTFRLP